MTKDEDPDESDPLAPIREHEATVEVVAERDDALGATAQCLLAWSRGEQPMKTTVEASYFDLDVGSDEFERWTPTFTGPPPGVDTVEVVVKRILAAAPERGE